MPSLRSHDGEQAGRAPRPLAHLLVPRAAHRARRPGWRAPILIGPRGSLCGIAPGPGPLCAFTPGPAGLEHASSPVDEESHPTPCVCSFQSSGVCALCAQRCWLQTARVAVAAQRFSFKIRSGFSCSEGRQSQVWTSALGWGRPGFCLCHDRPGGCGAQVECDLAGQAWPRVGSAHAPEGGRLRVTEAWPTSLPRSDSFQLQASRGNASHSLLPKSIVRGQSGQEGGGRDTRALTGKLENLGLRSPPNSFCIFSPCVITSWKITVKKMKPQRAVRPLLTRRDPRVPKWVLSHLCGGHWSMSTSCRGMPWAQILARCPVPSRPSPWLCL